MKIVITILLLASAVHSIPVSLRFIFMPKLFNQENINQENSQLQPEFQLQRRSDQPQPSFSFMEPMIDQPPMAFTAQAHMAVAPPAPFIPLPDPSTSSMQRRMDADEELLSQMPFSPQRRIDEEVIEPQEMPPPIPFMPIPSREMGPMPFLVRMPLPINDQQQQQQPFMNVNQPERPLPPMHIQLPLQKPQIQVRAFPIVSQPNLEEEEQNNEDVEAEVDDPQEEIEENIEENPINVRSQRILVIESAQRLRPVVMDSLQTVMKIFNAFAPPAEVTTTKAPEVNVTTNGNVEKMAQKLDRSLEMLTMQVADALGTLTAHAKQMLPMLMRGNATSGIVENSNDTIEVRSDEPMSNNEIKTVEESSLNAQNLQNVTDTVSKFVQLNSDEFRRTWKHFLHHYWTYVQKLLETAQ